LDSFFCSSPVQPEAKRSYLHFEHHPDKPCLWSHLFLGRGARMQIGMSSHSLIRVEGACSTFLTQEKSTESSVQTMSDFMAKVLLVRDSAI
jgi:hypothetical protein